MSRAALAAMLLLLSAIATCLLQVTVLAVTEVVHASAEPSIALLPSQTCVQNQKTQTLAVRVDVSTRDRGTAASVETLRFKKRTPFELCIVMDTSGSMDGDKIAASKEAIVDLLNRLDASDRVHLVTYESSASVLFEDGQVSRLPDLIRAVNSVRAVGGTNMGDGIQLGVKTLRKYADSERGDKLGRIRRMFLFSDGLVNVGETNPSALNQAVSDARMEHGITTSAFGIGSDFDDRLMKDLAESGAGDYLFLKNRSAIEQMLEISLTGLMGLVGTQAKLTLTPANQVKILKMYGPVQSGAPLTFAVGDLRLDDSRKFLAELEVAVPHSSAGGWEEDPHKLLFLTYTFTYLDATIDSQPQRVLTGSLTVCRSDDATVADRSAVSEIQLYHRIKVVEEQEGLISQHLREQDLNAAAAMRREVSAQYAALKATIPDRPEFAELLRVLAVQTARARMLEEDVMDLIQAAAEGRADRQRYILSSLSSDYSLSLSRSSSQYYDHAEL